MARLLYVRTTIRNRQLRKLAKYHELTFFLGVLFTLFNVGLPVVVAACPMAELEMTGACCSVAASSTDESVTGYQDSSCCKTVIVAEPNLAEFLKGQTTSVDQTKLFLSVTSGDVDPGAEHFPAILNSQLVRLPQPDIPILVSSLLI